MLTKQELADMKKEYKQLEIKIKQNSYTELEFSRFLKLNHYLVGKGAIENGNSK